MNWNPPCLYVACILLRFLTNTSSVRRSTAPDIQNLILSLIDTTKAIPFKKHTIKWIGTSLIRSCTLSGSFTGKIVIGTERDIVVFPFSTPSEGPKLCLEFVTSCVEIGQACNTSVIYCKWQSLGNSKVVWSRGDRLACLESLRVNFNFFSTVLIVSNIPSLSDPCFRCLIAKRPYVAYRKNFVRPPGRCSMKTQYSELSKVSLNLLVTLRNERMYATLSLSY